MTNHSPTTDSITELLADLPRLLQTKQVAEVLQVTPRHVYRLMATGALASVKLNPTANGAVRVSRSSLARYLEGAAQ